MTLLRIKAHSMNFVFALGLLLFVLAAIILSILSFVVKEKHDSLKKPCLKTGPTGQTGPTGGIHLATGSTGPTGVIGNGKTGFTGPTGIAGNGTTGPTGQI